MAVQTAGAQWKRSLCGCDCGQWCYACCCPSCAYGTMVARIPAGTPGVCCAGNSCGACCLHWTLAGLPSLLGALFGFPVGGVFGWAIHLGTRGAIRNMHNIPGGCCEDCMIAACCESCAIVQEEYQLLPPQMPTILVAPVVQMVQPVVMQPVTMQPATMAQPSMMAQPSIGMPSTMAPPIPVAQAPPIYFSNSMAQAAPMKY